MANTSLSTIFHRLNAIFRSKPDYGWSLRPVSLRVVTTGVLNSIKSSTIYKEKRDALEDDLKKILNLENIKLVKCVFIKPNTIARTSLGKLIIITDILFFL